MFRTLPPVNELAMAEPETQSVLPVVEKGVVHDGKVHGNQ